MRFAESTNLKDDISDNPDAMEVDIKFEEDNKSFLYDISGKDKEIKRKEGLNNGLILVNGKRTTNSETSDYSELYYDIMME